MSAAARKAQIVECAIALFGRHGFSGTTTKALAKAAGVSEATIFKHFPTKADLHAAAFEQRTLMDTKRWVTELQGFVDREDDDGLVASVVRAMFVGYERDRDLHRMLLYAQLEQNATENQKLGRYMSRLPLFSFLRGYIEKRQADGTFAAGSPDLIAAALLSLPIYQAHQTKLYGQKALHSDDVLVEAFTRLILDGVRARATTDSPA